jgi:hypothetical protein
VCGKAAWWYRWQMAVFSAGKLNMEKEILLYINNI